MRPFNLQEALAGKPVVTRDGAKVTSFVIFPVKKYSLYGMIEGRGAPDNFTELGQFWGNGTPSYNDLFMASEKKEGWVNVYSGDPEAYIYPTQKEADCGACGGRVACVRIEWEE